MEKCYIHLGKKPAVILPIWQRRTKT